MFIRSIVIFGCAAASAACASHPATPGPSPVAATTATPPAATPAAGQAHTLVLEDKTLTQEEVNSMLAQGYKPQKGRGDQILYCRSEPQLGTHFEKKVCMTAEQIKTATAESQEATERLQRNLGNAQGH